VLAVAAVLGLGLAYAGYMFMKKDKKEQTPQSATPNTN